MNGRDDVVQDIAEESRIQVLPPAWIWHSEREGRLCTTLRQSFDLVKDVETTSLKLAVTGTVTVELDGQHVALVDESASTVATYVDIEAFPKQLKAGHHTLSFQIACTEPMPVASVGIHLHDRSVGFNAFVSGDCFYLRTDGSWEADEAPATEVCRYGEEPYGDLEASPGWFAMGGYGDIQTTVIEGVSVTEVQDMAVSSEDGVWLLTGTLKQDVEVPVLLRDTRQIFYHLRKQDEWKQLRQWHRSLPGPARPFMIVDLGREYNARFHVTNVGSSAVSILWSAAESMTELQHYDGCITEYVRVNAAQEVVVLAQGYRYARVELFGPRGEDFDLHLVWEQACVKLTQLGSFHSDAPIANAIFEVCCHTSSVCHQVGLWDGIKRDRLNWVYDIYMAAKSEYVLWGELDVLRRSLRELGEGTPAGYWMNGIESYSLWWMNSLWEYFWNTGDSSFVLEQREALHRHLVQLRSALDPDTGFFRGVERPFIEWVPMAEHEAHLALNAVLRVTLGNLEKLQRYIPDLQLRVDWRSPDLSGQDFLQAKTPMVWALGAASGVLDRGVLVDLLSNYRVEDPITPLSAFWYAEWCSQVGLQDHAWEVILKVWGTMLERGATTFWESVVLGDAEDIHDALTTYNAYGSYRISLCHSWSSTPVQWFSRFVLGVIPLEPGYRKVRILPRALPGMTRCKGRVPTPFGPIVVEWQMNIEGLLTYHTEIPDGVEVVADQVLTTVLLRGVSM